MLTKMLADKDFSRFWDLCLLVYGQVLGRAYGMGRSHARSPAFATGLKLVGGSAPKPLAWYRHLTSSLHHLHPLLHQSTSYLNPQPSIYITVHNIYIQSHPI